MKDVTGFMLVDQIASAVRWFNFQNQVSYK